MKKIFKNQPFYFENGNQVNIDVVVVNGVVEDIIAAEQINEFAIGDVINVNGDESLIRSEDVEIDFLKEDAYGCN